MYEYYTEASNQAAEIARRQNSGSDARSLIAPEESEVIQVDAISTPPNKRNKKKREINHQAKNRRQIQQLQRQKARRQSVENEKVMKQLKSQELKKKKQFGHVKSKVFDTTRSCTMKKSNIDPSSSEISTVESTLESLTLSSNGSDLASGKSSILDVNVKNISTVNRHKDYGRVPEYILKRRISDAKKHQENLSKLDNSSDGPSDEVVDFGWKKDSARKKVLADLSRQENIVRESLSKLPFGLQSNGSIQKRQRLEQELKGIEISRKSLTKKVGMWNVPKGSAVGLVLGGDDD